MRLTRYLLARPLILMPLGAALLATTAGGFVTGNLELSRWIVVALLLIPLIDLLVGLVRGEIIRWNRLIGAIGRGFDKWARYDGGADNQHRPLDRRNVLPVLVLAVLAVAFFYSSRSTPSGSSSSLAASRSTGLVEGDHWEQVRVEEVSVRSDTRPMRVRVSGVVANDSPRRMSVNLVTFVHGAPKGEAEYVIGGQRGDWVTVPANGSKRFEIRLGIGGWWEEVTRAEVVVGEASPAR